MPVNKVVVAAFDFDGTLTKGDTLLPFLACGLGWPKLLLGLLVCLPWLAGFALGLVPNHVAKQKLLMVTLKGKSTAQLADWTGRWLAQSLPGQLPGWATPRLAEHQQAGHCCVMVSASPDIYLERVARQLGFDALLCTEMTVQSGHLTGSMKTPNCHGEQKVLRLTAWMTERFGKGANGVTVYAYGDTAGDQPMLRMATHAFYRGKPWPAP